MGKSANSRVRKFFLISGNSPASSRFVTDVEVMMDADHVLVEKLKARDEAAFVELIERYHGYLIPLANYFVSDLSVAEEVVQEAWMAVLTGIDRFEERSSFKTWLSRIVMNLARTRGVRES